MLRSARPKIGRFSNWFPPPPPQPTCYKIPGLNRVNDGGWYSQAADVMLADNLISKLFLFRSLVRPRGCIESVQQLYSEQWIAK